MLEIHPIFFSLKNKLRKHLNGYNYKCKFTLIYNFLKNYQVYMALNFIYRRKANLHFSLCIKNSFVFKFSAIGYIFEKGPLQLFQNAYGQCKGHYYSKIAD